jgi:putative DNA primase/helicase
MPVATDFYTVLVASGFVLDRAIPDGKWHRVKTIDKPKHRNGAYLLRADGTAGFFKNWATDLDFNTWQREGELSRSAKLQTSALALAAQHRAAEYQARQVKAMRAHFHALPPLRNGHPYLEAKALDMRGCGALRIDGDLLVIPVMRDGFVMSLQTIAQDGQKRFSTGCPVKGGVLVLDRPQAVLTCFVEGFATGLAVYQSIHQCRVVVCFDSGNLVEVAKHYQGRGLGVVCADNDWQTAIRIGSNPGLVAGKKAAELMGCGMAYPEDIEGSDWADAITEFGEDARRWISRKIMSKSLPFKRGVVAA